MANAFLQAVQQALPALAVELGIAKAPVHIGAAAGHTELVAYDRELDDRR